jgi:hypothetical protein
MIPFLLVPHVSSWRSSVWDSVPIGRCLATAKVVYSAANLWFGDIDPRVSLMALHSGISLPSEVGAYSNRKTKKECLGAALRTPPKVGR